MKRKIIQISMFFSLGILVLACSKDDLVLPEMEKYIKIGEAVSANSNISIEMYAHDTLFVGYNHINFKVKNLTDGKDIKQAIIEMHPLMDMVAFSHACPFENPSSTADEQGYFEGFILFSMPGNGGSWTVDVDVAVNGVTETSHFVLDKVIATSPGRKIVVIDSLKNQDGSWKITKYPMSLVLPKAWKVGINPFEFTIHQMKGMMDFPPVTDMTIEITPEMPSMGHGSPNNVNPVHIGKGHYTGNVNFTMTGDWRIHLTIKKDGRLISDKAYFDILF